MKKKRYNLYDWDDDRRYKVTSTTRAVEYGDRLLLRGTNKVIAKWDDGMYRGRRIRNPVWIITDFGRKLLKK